MLLLAVEISQLGQIGPPEFEAEAEAEAEIEIESE